MAYVKTTEAEIDRLVFEARRARAAKGRATRRVRQWLRNLFALDDPRKLDARYLDEVSLLEQLYRLDDPRG